MADYKIANIKWLREKGWEISSSYADSICPTYNEIVNEIPKNSITVDVNGTCIATSKAYANNQLVCESDITIEPVVDCSKYGFTANTLNEVISTSSTRQLAFSIYSEGELTATVVEGSDVVTGITTPTAGPYYQYIGWFAENQSTSPKHAKIRYTSSDGCEWEQTVTQKGKPAQQYIVSTNLIISSGSSGSLRVTGSTYTAEFAIAGPNAGTGTLTGTLTPDARDKMTFSGLWDGSPGATIYNSCTSHAQQGIYAIGNAHWDISTQKLYVNLIQCTP